MAARADWIKAGSPRQRSNIFYIKYKKLNANTDVSIGKLCGSMKGKNSMISVICKT